jgi:hypothetical protein
MKTKGKGNVIKLWGMSALAMGLPAAVLWFHSQPTQAITPDKLWIQVFSDERNRIESELGQRDSKLVTLAEATARWNALQQSMLDDGASLAEAKGVLKEAKQFLPTDKKWGRPLPHWPILVKRGYVRGKPMWVTICAAQADEPLPAEIVTGWQYWVRTIDPANPKDMSANQVFPRCEGPNTPFPVHLP